MTRNFYALDLDFVLQQTNQGCHTFVSLSHLLIATASPTTSDRPDSFGLNFAAGICIYGQNIFVLREVVTSFMSAYIIDTENHSDKRDGLICVGLRPIYGPPAVICVNPAPGFVKLKRD